MKWRMDCGIFSNFINISYFSCPYPCPAIHVRIHVRIHVLIHVRVHVRIHMIRIWENSSKISGSDTLRNFNCNCPHMPLLGQWKSTAPTVHCTVYSCQDEKVEAVQIISRGEGGGVWHGFALYTVRKILAAFAVCDWWRYCKLYVT